MIGPTFLFASYCTEASCFPEVTHSSNLPGTYVALRKAPKWLKRPVGATFGFGGTLVSFAPKKTTPGTTAVGSEVRGRCNRV